MAVYILLPPRAHFKLVYNLSNFNLIKVVNNVDTFFNEPQCFLTLHPPNQHIYRLTFFMFIVLLNFSRSQLFSHRTETDKKGHFLIRKNIQIFNTLHGNIKSKLDFNGKVLIPKIDCKMMGKLLWLLLSLLRYFVLLCIGMVYAQARFHHIFRLIRFDCSKMSFVYLVQMSSVNKLRSHFPKTISLEALSLSSDKPIQHLVFERVLTLANTTN